VSGQNISGEPLTVTAYGSALRQLLILTGLGAALWGLQLYGRILDTPALVLVWLLLALMIARGLFWRHRIRRRAWLGAYVHEDSVWQRRLRGGVVMATRHGIAGLLLGAVLLVVLVRVSDGQVWRLLLFTGALIMAARLLTEYSARNHINPQYLPEFAWRVTLWVVGVLLLAALVWLAFSRPQPDFTEASLAQAVWHMMDQEAARSALLQEALQLLAAKEGLQFWLAQNLIEVPGAHGLAVVLFWLLIFAEQALFVGAWLLVFNGVVTGVNQNAGTDPTP